MQKIELKNAFIDILERERTLRGWTQWEMAEKLEMSVPGYRKMVSGLTDSISLYTAFRASVVLNIPIPVLCGSNEYKDQLLKKIYNTPLSICNRIEYYLDYEEKFRIEQKKAVTGSKIIDVITLTGYMEDGMILDSSSIEKMEIKNDYGGRASKGFKITENSFLPTYCKGDILLVEEKTPRNGDTAVIVNMKSRLVYIRKIIIGDKYKFVPVNNRGTVITVEQRDRPDWADYGRVVACIRNTDI